MHYADDRRLARAGHCVPGHSGWQAALSEVVLGVFQGFFSVTLHAWTSRVAGLSETALAVFQGFCSIRKALFLGVFTRHPTMLQETMMGSASQGSWLGTIKNEHRSIKH